MAPRGSHEGNMVRRAGAHNALPDEDPIQSREWEQSVEQVIEQQGAQRAERLLHTAIAAGKDGGIEIDTSVHLMLKDTQFNSTALCIILNH